MSEQSESERDRHVIYTELNEETLRGTLVDDRHVIHAEQDEETKTLRVWYDRSL